MFQNKRISSQDIKNAFLVQSRINKLIQGSCQYWDNVRNLNEAPLTP